MIKVYNTLALSKVFQLYIDYSKTCTDFKHFLPIFFKTVTIPKMIL